MVIQSNMPSEAIVEVWSNTIEVLTKYNIPIVNQSLENLVEDQQQLLSLLKELNLAVKSSDATCIEGG